MKKKYLSKGSEWTFELLEKYEHAIKKIAEHYLLDTYPNQIEIITAEQMMDAYAASGMPLGYQHWSFGKKFLNIEKRYVRGAMGLAYEMVINANPCISYLLEENTINMQAMVLAHACYGHNSFFKGNYLFQAWTSADSIIDYLLFAKSYIEQCEEKYGTDKVEELLDTCHMLMDHGVDKYRRPPKLSVEEEKDRQAKREEYLQSQVNRLWKTIPDKKLKGKENKPFPEEPEENLLYFFEKHAPFLEPWQREILRIVRKIAQYFYPQRQTKIMNEGWATFWHYTIMHDLYKEKQVNDAFMLEFIHNHSDVIYQPPFNSPYFHGINPYRLGFSIWQDLRRICESPLDEDKKWFPDIAGSNWLETIDYAMRNYKDESFIAQFLSPKVIRDLKLFSLLDDDREDMLKISAIHDEEGYQIIRNKLSNQYNLSYQEPNIQVYNVNHRGDRSLTLRHYQRGRKPLNENTEEILKHLYRLWGFTVKLETVAEDGSITLTGQCPAQSINLIVKN